jgi:hypothetical protein
VPEDDEARPRKTALQASFASGARPGIVNHGQADAGDLELDRGFRSPLRHALHVSVAKSHPNRREPHELIEEGSIRDVTGVEDQVAAAQRGHDRSGQCPGKVRDVCVREDGYTHAEPF